MEKLKKNEAITDDRSAPVMIVNMAVRKCGVVDDMENVKFPILVFSVK